MNIAHAHNYTTDEFVKLFRSSASSPLEVEMMRRLEIIEDNLYNEHELEEEIEKSTDSLYALLEKINSELQQVLFPMPESNDLYDKLYEIQELSERWE